MDDFDRESQRIIDEYRASSEADRELHWRMAEADKRKHARRERWMLFSFGSAVVLILTAMYLASK